MRNIEELISDGYITKRKHPSENLFILNYTAKTQYEKLWNETTMACRGLIVDSSGTIRARCLKKFFNYEEVTTEVERRISSHMPFKVFDKIDGSLGILYWVGDEPFIATRGSFESPQALRANEILRSKAWPGLRRDLTYLFEIVYPDNRICVDYGDMEDLILLSAIHTESGDEVDCGDHPFTAVDEIDSVGDFASMKDKDLPNKEGFVVRFSDGFRFKLKFEQYIRLHSMIFTTSSRSVWKCLSEGQKIPIDFLPDEIYKWIKDQEESLTSSRSALISEAISVFSRIKHLPRREFAGLALPHRFSSLLFAMLDSKPYEQLAWKLVEPEYTTPFEKKRLSLD